MSNQAPLFAQLDSRMSKVGSRVEEIIGAGLDARKLAENFEVLVNVPGSAKHLKELVLQLAVRGRLSSPSGETADSLVSEIQRARAKLAKAGLRLGDPSVPVPDDEVPYLLPSGWRWIRFRDLGAFLGGGTPAKSNPAFWKGPMPWVSPKDMKRPYIDDAEDHISMAAVEASAVKVIPSRSILYVVRGMILAHSFPVAVTTREVTINQDMKALILAMPTLSEFILRSCQAARPRVLAQVKRSSHGTCRLESEAMEMLPIALPPIIEQTQIVAKVEELMGLCNDLEAQQARKREVGMQLTKSALEAVTTAEGPVEFDPAWKRVAKNFDMVLQEAAGVEHLRQMLLWLATHGRLVEPCAGETGRELLERIRVANRRRWEAAALREFSERASTPRDGKGKAKYKSALHADAMDSLVASLPKHWAAASLQEIAEVIDPNPSHRYPTYANGVVPLLSTREFRGRDGWDASGRNVPLVPLTVHREQEERCRFGTRDLIMARKGRLGLARHPPPLKAFVFSHTVFVVKVVEEMEPDYLLWFLRLNRVVAWLRREMNDNTGVPTLGKATTERLPVPIPPLAEQRRIVTKIEHLIKVCDDLEAKLGRAEDRAAKLLAAAVQESVV